MSNPKNRLTYDLVAVKDRLRQRCEEAGGQRAFALQHGLNEAYLSQVLTGVRPPSDNLCKAIGLRAAQLWEDL